MYREARVYDVLYQRFLTCKAAEELLKKEYPRMSCYPRNSTILYWKVTILRDHTWNTALVINCIQVSSMFPHLGHPMVPVP